MDERVLQLRIGLFLLIALIILGILIVYNTETGWGSQYSIHIKAQTAPGVGVGTPVRKNGIRIGRVSKVKTQDEYVALTLKINEKERVFEGEVCSIGADSFLGDSVVEIVPVKAQMRGEQLLDGGLLTKVSIKRNPIELIDVAINLEDDIKETLAVIRSAGASVERAGTGIDAIADEFGGLLQGDDSQLSGTLDQFREMSQKAQLALDNLNRLFENVNNVVGDPDIKAKVNDALATLPEIFEDVRNTITTTRETIDSFNNVSGTASTNLENLETFTASLRDEGPEILQQVNASLKNIDELVKEVKEFAGNLEDFELKLPEFPDFSKGTIGKLLNETELYDNANTAVENVKDVTYKLEPLMRDLRRIADGIARDPGQLGVRGALERRPANTGYKGGIPPTGRVFRR